MEQLREIRLRLENEAAPETNSEIFGRLSDEISGTQANLGALAAGSLAFESLLEQEKAKLEWDFEALSRRVEGAFEVSEQLDAALDRLANLTLLKAERELDAAQRLLSEKPRLRSADFR